MEHRHLTPHEFDLLVDGEEGFGVAPLRAHVEECVACRHELESQARIVAALEELPHFTPSPRFAYKVMRDVRVFEPWHVAAANSIQRFIPRSRPARALAAGVAGLVAATVTAGSVWLANRLDLVAFLASIGLERMREAGTQAFSGVATATLGASAVGAGGGGLAMAATAFLAAVAVAAIGLRAMAAVSRRRRM